MFKSARWRTEKNKVKAEFKLQFYVTKVFLGILILFLLSLLASTLTMILEAVWLLYSWF